MKRAALRLAMSAMLGLGVLGVGNAFAQGEQEGAPWQQPNNPYWIPRNPVPAPGWGAGPGPGWIGPGPGWRYSHRRGWYGPGVGVYVEPAPRYYSRRTYTRRVGNAHVEWCYDQYRSYREWDNTWQPYRGPRRECISPYS